MAILVGIGIVATAVYAIIKLVQVMHALFTAVGGSQNEKQYSESITRLVKEGIRVAPRELIAGEIIIDEGKGDMHTKIRRWFFTKLKHKELDIVLINQFPTESEKMAYLLKQAVREVLYTCLLPDEFMEALIVHIAFKFARRELKNHKIEQSLIRELDSSKYSGCVKKLDSVDFEKQIVLNEEPRARPLLQENILPILGIKTQEFLTQTFTSSGDELLFQQQQREFFMDWIGKICDDKVRILWIGRHVSKDYFKCIDKNHTINHIVFFIFGARHIHIDKLNYFMAERMPKKYRQYTFETQEIVGQWVHRSRVTNMKWIFAIKKSVLEQTKTER